MKDFLEHILEEQELLNTSFKQSKLHKAERTKPTVENTDKWPPNHQEKTRKNSLKA